MKEIGTIKKFEKALKQLSRFFIVTAKEMEGMRIATAQTGASLEEAGNALQALCATSNLKKVTGCSKP